MYITSNDGSRYREERARKAVTFAIEIAGLTEQQADYLITQVCDFKGTLEVTWKIPPSQQQRLAFSRAWLLCKESECGVRHFVGELGDDPKEV